MFAGNEHSELPAISNSWLSGVWPIPICSPKKVGRFIPHLFTGWWLISPIEKYEFVSWDYYSQYMESHKIHVPNHQAVHQPVHLVHYPCVVIHPILKKNPANSRKSVLKTHRWSTPADISWWNPGLNPLVAVPPEQWTMPPGPKLGQKWSQINQVPSGHHMFRVVFPWVSH